MPLFVLYQINPLCYKLQKTFMAVRERLAVVNLFTFILSVTILQRQLVKNWLIWWMLRRKMLLVLVGWRALKAHEQRLIQFRRFDFVLLFKLIYIRLMIITPEVIDKSIDHDLVPCIALDPQTVSIRSIPFVLRAIRAACRTLVSWSTCTRRLSSRVPFNTTSSSLSATNWRLVSTRTTSLSKRYAVFRLVNILTKLLS